MDTTTVKSPEGVGLSGDQAARILDIVGIVVNRNTIPGDKNSRDPSGIRLAHRGSHSAASRKKSKREVASIIADVLSAAAPHAVDTVRKGRQRRAKVDFNVLNDARRAKAGRESRIDFKYKKSGYPHFITSTTRSRPETTVFELKGSRIRQVLDSASPISPR